MTDNKRENIVTFSDRDGNEHFFNLDHVIDGKFLKEKGKEEIIVKFDDVDCAVHYSNSKFNCIEIMEGIKRR